MTPDPWRLRRPLPPVAESWRPLAEAWDLSPAAARLAWLRGAEAPEDLAWRLDPDWERASDPYALAGVGEAVARIRSAIQDDEAILVYGDYDVDGVTATALLVRVLERLGAKVDFFIPNRFSDGYGLHLDCVQELVATRRPGLAVSVDCGVRSGDVVAASREMGLDWIITDHHALGAQLPPACAVVHPALDGYPNPFLAGVGVAFKLAQALLDTRDRTFLDGLLKLVALGTVADVVPLAGENALLVKRGLQALGGSNGPGLAALLKVARFGGRAQDIAFGVAPRLNAVGRMGGAEDAVHLLLSRDAAEAGRLMERVEALNQDRRAVQKALAGALPAVGPEAFDLVVSPEAHKGVIGILAGQRMRASGRPTGVCAVQDGVAHCSLRAPAGYDLSELLSLAAPYLRTGGGHRAAAGMTFDLSRLSFVQKTLAQGASRQARDAGPVCVEVDGLGSDPVPAATELDRLEPFGAGFPAPLVVLAGTLAGAPKPFGDGHLRLTLSGVKESLTWFGGPPDLKAGQHLSLACGPQDSPTYGRTWLVDAAVGEEARP